MDRRAFIGTATAGAGAWLVAPRARSAATFPRQDPDLVRQVVQFAHFDIDAVRELVSERPALAKAAWDWGFGDWETPLGAASHVGGVPIARFLMSQGARPNLFTFAMLGHVDAVRAMVRASPGAQRIPGPHGLSLLHHARAGGPDSESVVSYLEELGDANPSPTDLPMVATERRDFTGTYRTEDSRAFTILDRREHLAFQYGEDAPRELLRQAEREFHPVGAPAVRFVFDLRGGRADRVTIRDGARRTVAVRIAP